MLMICYVHFSWDLVISSPQAFNAYKIQRQKEEREEARMRQKKAKEDFEDFLVNKVSK